MDRYFCFRFDVDTHRCIRKGVPNLLRLSDRVGAKFTFFTNMGRAVSRTRALRRRLRPAGREPDSAAKLSPAAKLGLRDLLVAAVLNPPVGAGSPAILRDALAADHEIGLHGGGNHAIWQAEAHTWTAARLRKELLGAVDQFRTLTGRHPRAFASPGWNRSPHLPPILDELGFEYLADVHGPQHPAITREPTGRHLISVRTDLCGEPGGVAYLEHLRALGLDDQAIREHFRARLRATDRLAVAYDHPYHAGTRELRLIPDLLSIARELGFQVVALGEAVDALRDDVA